MSIPRWQTDLERLLAIRAQFVISGSIHDNFLAQTAGGPALVPFILKGIADRPDADDWFQADRIHPIAKAHPIILDNVWPALKPLLRP